MSRKKLVSTDNSTLGGRLRYWRAANNLTLDKVAVMTGIGQGTLSRIENSEQDPKAESLTKIIAGTNINPLWLIAGEEPVIKVKQTQIPGGESTQCVKELGHQYGSAPRRTHDVEQLMEVVRRIMTSNNEMMKDALYSNIIAFEHAVKSDERIAAIERAIGLRSESSKQYEPPLVPPPPPGIAEHE